METSAEKAVEKEIDVVKFLLISATKYKDVNERTAAIEAHISTEPEDVQELYLVYMHMQQQQLTEALLALRKKENLCLERTNTLLALEAAEAAEEPKIGRKRTSSFSKIVEGFEEAICQARDSLYDKIDKDLEKEGGAAGAAGAGGIAMAAGEEGEGEAQGRVRSKSVVEAFEDVVVGAAAKLHKAIDKDLGVLSPRDELDGDGEGRKRSKSLVEAFEDVVVKAASSLHKAIDKDLGLSPVRSVERLNLPPVPPTATIGACSFEEAVPVGPPSQEAQALGMALGESTGSV